MRLVRNGKIVEDPYRRLPDDSLLPDKVAVLVSADRLLVDTDAIIRHQGAAGVLWPNDRGLSELAPYLNRLALIVLSFPSFKDGRAYSQAHSLRERYGFRGELRATGQILRDQFLFLLRSGFDAFEITKDADIAAFADSVSRYSVFYQPGPMAVPLPTAAGFPQFTFHASSESAATRSPRREHTVSRSSPVTKRSGE